MMKHMYTMCNLCNTLLLKERLKKKGKSIHTNGVTVVENERAAFLNLSANFRH